MARIIAVDYGDKRMGLALADLAMRIALPWKVIQAKGDPSADAATIWQELSDSGEQVELFVVGLPLNMDGTVGARAELTKIFGEALHEVSNIPVEYVDERLSSFDAEKKFHTIEKGFARPKKRKRTRKPLDAVAASVILEDYLKKSG